MTETKPKVTLIGRELAKNGLEFIYEGAIGDCGSCKISKACNNLKKGRRYRIVGVRTTEHNCPVHLNGALSVEVIESPIPVLISADMAIRNTKIQFEFSCSRENCPNYDLCRPEGLIEGEKYIVMDVIGNAPDICEKGRSLQLVELMPVQ
jgi:uncharacterized protein (UPF0179 family)